MVDGQNELNLEQREPAAAPPTPERPADTEQGDAGDLTVPAAASPTPERPADTEQGDAGDLTVPAAAPPTPEPPADTGASDAGDRGESTAVDSAALREGAAAAAGIIGQHVDSVLTPVFAEYNGTAAEVSRSMAAVSKSAAGVVDSLGKMTSTTGSLLDSVENATAATAGPDGWTDTRTEFALFRKDVARLRSYESRVRRWVLRILLAVAVMAIPAAFLAGSFAQRDLAVLDFGREAGFRRAWSDWIWRHHSTGLLDCALEARRRGEALTCQIRMAPPQ